MRFQVSALRRRSGCGGVKIVEKDIEGETRCVDTRGLLRPQREGAGIRFIFLPVQKNRDSDMDMKLRYRE